MPETPTHHYRGALPPRAYGEAAPCLAGLERRRTEGKPVGRQPGAADKKLRRRSGYVARWERERRGGPRFLPAPDVLRHRVLDGEPDRGGHVWRHAGITGRRRSTGSSSRSRDGDSWPGRALAKGTKRIPVSQIAAVQWKPAGPLVNGFIQFTLPGGMERRSRMGRQTKSAVDDENSVIFTRNQMPAFDQLRAAIEAELAARNAPAHRRAPQATQQDPAAQLRKLGELRQGGLISELEYAAKREEIINRL